MVEILQSWEAVFIAYLPTIMSVVSMIIALIKVINTSKENLNTVKSELKTSNKDLKSVKKENAVLVGQIQELNKKLVDTNARLDSIIDYNTNKVVK